MYGLNTERSLICFIYVCISGAAATWSSDCTTVISRQLKPLRCTTVAAGRQRQQQQQQLCTKYKHTEFWMMIPSQTVKLPCTLNCACVLFEWSSTISSITMRYRRSVHLIHMQCIVISTKKKKIIPNGFVSSMNAKVLHTLAIQNASSIQFSLMIMYIVFVLCHTGCEWCAYMYCRVVFCAQDIHYIHSTQIASECIHSTGYWFMNSFDKRIRVITRTQLQFTPNNLSICQLRIKS